MGSARLLVYCCRRGHTRPDVSPERQPEIPLISSGATDIETLLHRIENTDTQATKYGQLVPSITFEFGKISSTNVGKLQVRIRCLEVMIRVRGLRL